MKIITTAAMLLLAIAFSFCSRIKGEQPDQNHNPKSNDMKNLVSIVEIPTADFPRAVKFYQTILDVTIEEVDMEGTRMGVLPSNGKTVNLVLVKGSDYKPTPDGAVVYLNAGVDLQPMLNKVEKNGGQVVVPKTVISPEMGYFALFIDTEGNKLGLHSSN